MVNKRRKRAALEIDFVVNSGAKRLYIQSAYMLEDAEKAKKEKRSLKLVGDGFRKLIVVGEDIHRKIDDDGIVTMGLFDFLLIKIASRVCCKPFSLLGTRRKSSTKSL